MTEKTYTVGQVIFVVLTANRPVDIPITYFGKVTKVGRKWVTFTHEDTTNESRFDAKTAAIDAGQYPSPGSVYLNEQEYNERVAFRNTWRKFKSAVEGSWQPPEGITTADIEAAYKILFKDKKQYTREVTL